MTPNVRTHPRRAVDAPNIYRNSRSDGSVPRFARHRCLSLLCTKAFDFNWASRRENARTRYARGILDFRKNQVFADCGERWCAGYVYPDGVSGARRVGIEIEWMYISVGDLCPRSTSNSDARPSAFGFILFLLPAATQPSPFPPLPPRHHISIERSTSPVSP